ncbi:MAG: RES domain-containing protein [Candidatus Azotimanducaceae bacterium]|jgi:RES domain-containing protein
MESTPETVRVWRLVKTTYAASAFDGEGAFRFGGRWNSRGQRVVYTSGALSLAVLEILVHLDPSAYLPEMSAVAINLPMSEIKEVSFSTLNEITGGLPWGMTQTRQWGNDWIKQTETIALKVPSALVPNESNYLINPMHAAFEKCRIEAPCAFPIDARLML